MENIIRRWDRTSFYPNRIVYYACFVAAALFMLSFLIDVLFTIAIVLLVCTGISLAVDFLLLYQKPKGVVATRLTSERLSNGDQNKIIISFKNDYDFKVSCIVIEEL